jgi:hypothetical protein
VKWVAFRVFVQPPRCPGGEGAKAVELRELLKLCDLDTAQVQDCPVTVPDQTPQTLEAVIYFLFADHKQHDHPVRYQPTQGEEQGFQGGLVGPLQVVNENHHRPFLLEASK